MYRRPLLAITIVAAGMLVASMAQAASPSPASAAPNAILYEEDPNDPLGKAIASSVVWRLATPAPGVTGDPVIQADVEVPERRLKVTLSFRRNTDKTLPASHTIELSFNLPTDFALGGIQNVPGVLMKSNAQARGTPLAGVAVKVAPHFFMVGLSGAQADMQRNLQLLKERPWFDVPIVFTNGRRAILAIEKGPPGEEVFDAVFTAWGQ